MNQVINDKLDEKLKRIISDVFGVDLMLIDENSSPDNIEAWDSLRQMSLIMALEEEFSITFSDDQVVEMLNYKLIRQALNEVINGPRES